jgi:hypothetical protein
MGQGVIKLDDDCYLSKLHDRNSTNKKKDFRDVLSILRLKTANGENRCLYYRRYYWLPNKQLQLFLSVSSTKRSYKNTN